MSIWGLVTGLRVIFMRISPMAREIRFLCHSRSLLQLTFPYVQDRGPAEVLAGGTLFHAATPGSLTQHALQAPGDWGQRGERRGVIGLRQDRSC